MTAVEPITDHPLLDEPLVHLVCQQCYPQAFLPANDASGAKALCGLDDLGRFTPDGTNVCWSCTEMGKSHWKVHLYPPES